VSGAVTAHSHSYEDSNAGVPHSGVSHGGVSDSYDIAAWIFDEPITVASVHDREHALRAGPFAAALPARSSPQGRNVLRWIVQLIATEAILSAEAHRLGLRSMLESALTDSAQAGAAPPSPTSLQAAQPPAEPALVQPYPAQPSLRAALEMGGVLATVLATVPDAAAVRRAVTGHVQVSEKAIVQYYQRNLDRFSKPEARVLSRLTTQGRRAWGRVVAGELPPAWQGQIFAAPQGCAVTVESGQVFIIDAVEPAVCQSFDEAAPALREMLREHEVNAAFASWVDAQRREWLRLNHGYEHPGDPRQPDATHRH
jgi:[acyl-carrier-protein] S-malonyltransferase